MFDKKSIISGIIGIVFTAVIGWGLSSYEKAGDIISSDHDQIIIHKSEISYLKEDKREMKQEIEKISEAQDNQLILLTRLMTKLGVDTTLHKASPVSPVSQPFSGGRLAYKKKE